MGQDAYKTALAGEIDALDRRLAADFPQYVELAGTIDLPVATVQQQLAVGEALVSYTLLEARAVALVVTRDANHLVPINAGRQELAYLVEDLRRGLAMAGGRLPSFRSDVAFDLYRTLINPVEVVLGDRPTQLILALSDVLESIPFSVLVTDPPRGNRLRELSWIVDRFAVSRVPSVSSLVMMRQIANPSAAPDPFLGIGDPLLNGNGSDFRGLAVNEAFNTHGALDSVVLQSLPRLAETADELRQLQQTLVGSETALLLGEAASERRVKALPLGDYRVVAFATHRLVAGEIGGFNEPGLVLTPPTQPDNDDDGYLAASEIADEPQRRAGSALGVQYCGTRRDRRRRVVGPGQSFFLRRRPDSSGFALVSGIAVGGGVDDAPHGDAHVKPRDELCRSAARSHDISKQVPRRRFRPPRFVGFLRDCRWVAKSRWQSNAWERINLT